MQRELGITLKIIKIPCTTKWIKTNFLKWVCTCNCSIFWVDLLKPASIFIFHTKLTFSTTNRFRLVIGYCPPVRVRCVSFLLLFTLSLPPADFLPPSQIVCRYRLKNLSFSMIHYFCLLLCMRYVRLYTWMRLILCIQRVMFNYRKYIAMQLRILNEHPTLLNEHVSAIFV